MVGDLALMLGSAKELCEAASKLVWVFAGQQFASSTDMSELTSKAQLAVDRLPGHGTATEDAARDIAQAARKLITHLNEARNAAGTGHGRVEASRIDPSDARFLSEAAVLWCRWLLARLDLVAANSPVKLVSDLRSSIFYKGVLAQRLQDADLASLDEVDQRAVGIAVGQRGGIGETVVVWTDGVRAPADSSDLERWPVAYREGVAEGVLVDANGYLHPSAIAVKAMLGVLGPLPDGGLRVIQMLVDLAGRAELVRPSYTTGALEAEAQLRAAAEGAGEPLASALEGLAERLHQLQRP